VGKRSTILDDIYFNENEIARFKPVFRKDPSFYELPFKTSYSYHMRFKTSHMDEWPRVSGEDETI